MQHRMRRCRAARYPVLQTVYGTANQLAWTQTQFSLPKVRPHLVLFDCLYLSRVVPTFLDACTAIIIDSKSNLQNAAACRSASATWCSSMSTPSWMNWFLLFEMECSKPIPA